MRRATEHLCLELSGARAVLAQFAEEQLDRLVGVAAVQIARRHGPAPGRDHVVAHAADEQPFQVQFQRDAEKQIDVQRIVMRHKGPCGGAAGGRDIHTVVQESTFEFVVDHRDEMLHDQLEMYVRGDTDAPRPECCPDPFKPEFHNWMHDYPQAYVIPFGEGQRSNAEANRLVEWMLFNDIEVEKLEQDMTFGSQTFEEGSYVVRMAQPRREG